MALVAYSDESDISDEEEELPKSSISNGVSDKNKQISSPKQSEGIESIEDDDSFLVPGSHNIISKLPQAKKVSASNSIVEEDDLDDVPTKETWKLKIQVGCFY